MIFQNSFEKLTIADESGYRPGDFPGFMESFPALLWRIEIAKWRIEFLNNFIIRGLGENTRLFLKNDSFRRELIVEEDQHKMDFFSEKMRSGITSFVLFRIKVDQQISWLKLSGWAAPRDPLYYYGLFQDVTNEVDSARSMFQNDIEQYVSIDSADHPALLVDYQKQKVIAVNEAGKTLFGYSTNEVRDLNFSKLYPQEITASIQRIIENILFDRKWSGRLNFVRKSMEQFNAFVDSHLIAFKGRNILRLALTGIEFKESGLSPRDGRVAKKSIVEFEKKLSAKLRDKNDIMDILDVFLNNQPPDCEFDGIIFSDIHSRKNKVFVYCAGSPFSGMEPGEMFSYQGTIAQQIEHFKLEHLIVDETMESIKAIDWALFIPKGIRSYFAKPFYSRKILKAVMILCSCKPNAFSAERLDNYFPLFRPFKNSIDAWRTTVR